MAEGKMNIGKKERKKIEKIKLCCLLCELWLLLQLQQYALYS
jgi:hypothetical protein